MPKLDKFDPDYVKSESLKIIFKYWKSGIYHEFLQYDYKQMRQIVASEVGLFNKRIDKITDFIIDKIHDKK